MPRYHNTQAWLPKGSKVSNGRRIANWEVFSPEGTVHHRYVHQSDAQARADYMNDGFAKFPREFDPRHYPVAIRSIAHLRREV